MEKQTIVQLTDALGAKKKVGFKALFQGATKRDGLFKVASALSAEIKSIKTSLKEIYDRQMVGNIHKI